MKQTWTNLTLFLAILVFLSVGTAQAQQTTVSGTVSDAKSGEPLIGVNVAIKGKVTGTITDAQGKFELSTNTPPPFTLTISSVGFLQQEIDVTGSTQGISIVLEEQTIMGQEVVVSASRMEESILESPVAIEKMDILAVRNVPAATFYESLQNLKGVELATQSATFQSVNTRGFALTGNARVLQLIDGMDSQSITNSFSYGNIVGISELDVQSVEILPGPSSVLYGPNAINGILLINSKNPFQYQGLSANAKVGVMHVNSPDTDAEPFYQLNLRYAKAFNDRFAFKINVGYVDALDWHATDTRNNISPARNLYDDGTRLTDPGYDGVNVYGDEGFNVLNLTDPALQGGLIQALVAQGTPEADATALVSTLPNQNVSRTGSLEPFVANYDAYSLKLHSAFHYRISENIEALAQINFNRGRTVYTGSGRFNVSNFNSGQVKLELRGSNFYVRGYANLEDAGDSYDVQTLGQRIETAWKDNETWYGEYAFAFLGLIPGVTAGDHNTARAFADNRTPDGQVLVEGLPARPLPGSGQFNQLRDSLIEVPINQFGTRFTAKNYFLHFEGMYNFENVIDPAVLEIIVGGHVRRFVPNTEGTIFDDLPSPQPDNPFVADVAVRDIRVNEFGGYVQLTKRLANDRLKLIGSARVDKNENFDARFTPRIAAVLSLGANKEHNLRLAYQTGFRNPTMLNQYQNLTVGGVVTLIGGLPEFIDRFFGQGVPVGVGSPAYTQEQLGLLLTGQEATPFEFDEFEPEFVQTVEAGYKALLGTKFYLDVYGYYNWYSNFIGNQILFQIDPNSPIGVRQYQVPINIDDDLRSFGWGASLEYKFPKGYNLAGNISSDVLATPTEDLPNNFLTQFNSPRYRTNVTFSNRSVYKGLGFNIAWRWQDDVLWQNEGFFSGNIPAFHVFDAMVSYQATKLKTIFKIGGSNIFNNRYRQAFGNPTLGAMYYVAITFDQFLN